MHKMNKKLLFDILYVVLIIGVLAGMLWLVFWLTTESALCMRDPITYYTNKTNLNCICFDGYGNWLDKSN